ncbi:calcium-binding protein, partial [Sulfuricurvum sp.]|uniref:calcium-binding protein n=1 Tax=Sulfuricurvum sp. TaxID=2025608 RepID=UPI002615669B
MAATVVIADKAHTLGTASDYIDGSANLSTGATFSTTASAGLVSGDTLTISGLLQYDTIAIATGTATSRVQFVAGNNSIQYSSDSGATWATIGNIDPINISTTKITFTQTVTDVIVQTLLRSLTISTNTTTGTVVDTRALSFTFAGSQAGTDASALSIVGSASADTILYTAAANGFDPLGGNDILKVDTGMGSLTLDMKTASTLEKFEVLDATNANSAIDLTLGGTVKTVTLGSAVDTINIAASTDMGTVSVNGGAGRDVLNATAGVTLIGTDLAKLSSVEILTLSNNVNSVTLGATDSIDTINGGSAVDTIDASARTVNVAVSGAYDLYINAGDGNDVVKASAGNDHIDLGNGNNTLTVTSTNLDSDDTIIGGTGTDKIILNGATISDVAFTHITSVETVEGIATTTTVTLGDKAKTAGITKIDLATTAATGAAVVDLSSMTSDGAFTVLAGTGGTTVKMTATNVAVGNDTLTGNATSTADILEVTTAGALGTVAGTVTNMDTLLLSAATGDSSVTIVDANNFKAVTATGAGNTTIDAHLELDVTGGITITTASGNDTITTGATTTGVAINAGNGNNTITVGTATNSITTGSGDDIVNLGAGIDAVSLGGSGALINSADTVKVAYADFTIADTVTGTGNVVLEFTTATAESDSNSDNIMDTNTVESKIKATGNAIDTIKLDALGAQSVTLGANTKAAGITELDGSALTGSLTADLSVLAPTSGTFTVKGGDVADTVIMKTADLTATTSIQGGNGSDVLKIIDVATVVDSDFTLSTNLENLVIAKNGAHSITLGDAAKTAGIRIINTSMDTITVPATPTLQTTGSTIDVSSMVNDANLTITMGSGIDTIKMNSAQLTSGDTINMGANISGGDTLEFTDSADILDTAFTNVSNVEIVKLHAGTGQKLTLAAEALGAGILEIDAAAATASTIDASAMAALGLRITTAAGDDTVSLGSGVANVVTGVGDDTVKVTTANLTGADSIDGGTHTIGDTLVITDAAALTDSSFAKVSNFEAVKLSDFGGQTVTLGSAAKAKAIANIDASALSTGHAVSVTLDSSYDASTVKVTGGAGDDVLNVSHGVVTSTLTYIGGNGTDTLQLSDNASIVDTDLAGLQSIEKIKLADSSTAQSITLAANASAAGISIIDGSALNANGSITIDASAMSTNVNISTVGTVNRTGGADIITAGHGNDTINTGAGDDIIKISSDYLNSGDTIDGGSQTTRDTLEITSSSTNISDAAFTNVSHIELIQLSGTGLYNLTLGTIAGGQSLSNVDVIGTGGANITLSALTAAALINGGAGIETITLAANAQANTLNLGGGDDVIKIDAAELTAADSIDGGGNSDTIEITTATSGTLTDADFTLVRNVETLKLDVNANQDVALGDKALNAGIRTIDATIMGTGKTLSIDMSGMATDVGMTINSGYGDDTFKIAAGELTSGDTIHGNLGNDTIEFVGAVTLVDSAFTNVDSVEIIKLGAGNDQSLTLGNLARHAGDGIKEINGAAATNVTVDLSSMSSDMDLKFTGGTGADTIKTKAAQLTASDTYIGGNGTDTIEFIDQVNLDTSLFTGVSGFEKISLNDATKTDAQTLTLANSATLNTVDASTITGVVTVDAHTFTNALNITTGTGADIVTIGNGVNTIDMGGGNDKVIMTSAALADANADTLVGGAGTDILEVTGTTAITDAKLTAITGFETLKLSGTGDKSVTVADTHAKANGITTVDASTTTGLNTIDAGGYSGAITINGGSGVDTITAGTSNNTISAGDGNDVIYVSAATLNSGDTIDGGIGNDTIILSGSASLLDANFTNITNVEKIILADANNQSIVIGDEAINGGSGITEVVAALTGTNKVTVDLSQASTNANTKVTTGAGADTIKIKSADISSADLINVGGGTDVLELTTAAGLVAGDMSGLTGFETLKLANVNAIQTVTLADGKFNSVDGSAITYAQAVTVDATLQAGALAITTAGGNDVLTLGSGANTINSGSGADTIKITAASFTSGDAINAGDGADVLQISGTATIIDSQFNNAGTLGIETLKLMTDGTGQSVTIAANASLAGVNTVDTTVLTNGATINATGMTTAVTVNAGSGDDTIKMGQGIDTINAGSGNDTIEIASGYLTGADHINGDGGTADVLKITDTAAITDAMLVNVKTIETIKLSDSATDQTIALGANAKANNLLIVDATASVATHNISIDIGGLSGKDVTINGGAGNETVVMSSADLSATDSIALGLGGSDILEFTDAVNLTNTALQAGLSGINTIKLSDNTNVLTVANGIGTDVTVNATAATGTKTSTIDVSAITSSVTVNTSVGNDTITLGSGVNTVNAGLGDDIIIISNTNFTNANTDTIDGGVGTADELKISGVATLVDANFANVTNVEKLTLTSTGAHTLTLGDEAIKTASGGYIRTVNASAAGANAVQINLSTATVDADMSITTGTGADTITMRQADLASTDTIAVGTGADELILTGTGSV